MQKDETHICRRSRRAPRRPPSRLKEGRVPEDKGYGEAELIYGGEEASPVLRRMHNALRRFGDQEAPSAESVALDVRELIERHGEMLAELGEGAYGAWEMSMRQTYREAFEGLGGEERRKLFVALSAYMAWAKALGATLLETALGKGEARVPTELYMYGGSAAVRLFADGRLNVSYRPEGDEYDWVFSPEVAPSLDAFFRDLGAGLARYDWAKAPGTDLLGRVYQRIVPEELRRQLGEYYTPGWVVKLMLWRALHLLVRGKTPDELLPAGGADGEVVGLLDEHYKRRKTIPRFVDPTCGSFAFGIQYVDALIRWYREKRPGVGPVEFIEGILNNVVGIDINPAAVIMAKVNYLLQIYRFLAANGAHLPRPPILPIIRLDLLTLHAQTPLEASDWQALSARFDLVLGNLPWVNVSKYPEGYRRLVKRVAQSLGMWPPGPAAKKMDISIPLFAIALRHLARGAVALMVPASIFRGVHGAKWRELLANHRLVEVWDLEDVKPFEGAQSQPGIVFVAV